MKVDPSPQVDVLMAWIDKQMTGYQLLEPSASPYGKPEEKEEYRQLTLPFL
mgnify:CR=1 FL=1